ncbi:NADH-ubiquinone oxidoreductase-F iron-sulfur binding region domain-containing protein [Mycobacterium sp. shizuoka-1]|uniref:NADH-ubiquinone oxidoreductase-F iron-sulfur binding region domain-containing protein n=1 Tax=Mycobacterium sp. shizuoka-1 TaxID=2039281 RepID=UPI000C06659D|nr:NADH-ubiquinone oxidoreductase-F iron-sulfur binding region domain-containing protein [Mycobacterium sp. shizuoka-1]GAY16463.1 NADH dehydrogenase [Mycobacterium sp. shizuoka-1]
MPRLLAAHGPSLTEHQDHFGAPPEHSRAQLVSLLEDAKLTGRGGAGFPTARKIAAITGGGAVVIGNGAEGEPLSRKDALLLGRAPHLVLDGLHIAAAALGADTVYLYVHVDAVAAVRAALDERRAAGRDPYSVTVVTAPDTFVAGEESAAIRHIEGGPALPRDRVVPTAISGLRRRPTLVNNVETLAHIALIARFGPDWFRSVGDREEPGTMLVTVSGAVDTEGVIEVPTGVRLTELIDARSVSAVLIGGYHGSWLPASAFEGLRLSRAGLQAVGATPGAGIVHALGATECGLARTAEIVGYLADESARQCGPCRNGLPRLAELFEELAYGRANDPLVKEVRRIARLVDGRGACRHPDGTARMIRSALLTFAADVELHRRGRCAAADAVASEAR